MASPLAPKAPRSRQKRPSRAEGRSALAIGFEPENRSAAADHRTGPPSERERPSPLALGFEPDRNSPVAKTGAPRTQSAESKGYLSRRTFSRSSRSTLLHVIVQSTLVFNVVFLHKGGISLSGSRSRRRNLSCWAAAEHKINI